MRIWSFFIVLFALGVIFPSGPSGALELGQENTGPEIFSAESLSMIEPEVGVENPLLIQVGMTQALETGKMGAHKFYDTPGMKAFYEARGHKVAWLESSFFRARKAETLLKTFENSWTHGLNPNHYHVEEIRRLMREAKGARRYELELLLSDALVRYGRDLTGMRVPPRKIGQKSKYWRQPLRGIDVLQHVAEASSARDALKSMAPQGNLYKKLREELIRLYKTPLDDASMRPVSLKGLIRPGDSHKAVARIRERMGYNSNNASQGAYYYDDNLAQAVMAFQKAHGLKADAIIGPHTVKLMNMTREDRIHQVLVNLERLRWMEPARPERYVIVNVPSATLWAMEGGQVRLEMPVVVGRKKRPTKSFTTTITGIRYNPTWTVPPTIKKEDYLPKLQEDPYYLADRGIELMDGKMSVDPGQIDWANKTWEEVNAMRMVQGSGRTNPLGLVRVIMSNPYNIYLHDTPKKSQFALTNRAFSSGCVRMERALDLADFVLEPNDNWSPERRDAVLTKGKMTDIWAHEPMPVYIVYNTVWLGDRGQVVYGSDLYGHDRILLQALRDIGSVMSVEEQETTVALSDYVIN
ncbi:MAG: L,D-transpeptidase family protein [Alphaproteobacteria bacterium]|nr:L,D-transpeptidase family protein [Alphaproteobacteria bacterium]